jgi:hypothetical protein
MRSYDRHNLHDLYHDFIAVVISINNSQHVPNVLCDDNWYIDSQHHGDHESHLDVVGNSYIFDLCVAFFDGIFNGIKYSINNCYCLSDVDGNLVRHLNAVSDHHIHAKTHDQKIFSRTGCRERGA